MFSPAASEIHPYFVRLITLQSPRLNFHWFKPYVSDLIRLLLANSLWSKPLRGLYLVPEESLKREMKLPGAVLLL